MLKECLSSPAVSSVSHYCVLIPHFPRLYYWVSPGFLFSPSSACIFPLVLIRDPVDGIMLTMVLGPFRLAFCCWGLCAPVYHHSHESIVNGTITTTSDVCLSKPLPPLFQKHFSPCYLGSDSRRTTCSRHDRASYWALTKPTLHLNHQPHTYRLRRRPAYFFYF